MTGRNNYLQCPRSTDTKELYISVIRRYTASRSMNVTIRHSKKALCSSQLLTVALCCSSLLLLSVFFLVSNLVSDIPIP